jgi:arylsulfatase A-like enzyme
MNAQKKEAFNKQWTKGGMDPGPLLVPENQAVRTKEWKYITYPRTGETELYNLINDPYEMKNLVTDPKYADIVRKMKARLAQLVEETK